MFLELAPPSHKLAESQATFNSGVSCSSSMSGGVGAADLGVLYYFIFFVYHFCLVVP